ncbi:hypothetical protein [Caulobacter hibisci]|uniref:Uncharacterized protein n=1 Tax=Caulobacter hibisci TaxID=2035993 RepID=A0ABS0T2B5_9CAUL|nr:hypothetical protein [Caulobacter hibisci]MBI1685959.1 hypothetical protein [Caulobacter hibisci]
MLLLMSNDTSRAWCAKIQQRLMAAMDDVWAAMEDGLDREALRKASDKVRLLGQMAATVRKIVVALPPERAARTAGGWLSALEAEIASPPRPERKIDALKGGARGRL